MIAEAIASIQKLTTDANELQVLELGEPNSVARVVKRDGSIELIAKTAPHRRIEAHTLSDLVQLAAEPFDEAWVRRAIFYSMSKITLVFDWLNGYEVAELALPWTDELKFFEARRKEPSISVMALNQHLLTTLRKTREEEAMEAFMTRVGALASSNGEKTAAEASRHRQGIAKNIIEEIAKPEELPEEMQVFHVRPFAVPDIGNRFDLSCTLLPRPADTSWLLKPLEESLLTFQREVMDFLTNPLTKAVEAKVPIYCGTWSTQS